MLKHQVLCASYNETETEENTMNYMPQQGINISEAILKKTWIKIN